MKRLLRYIPNALSFLRIILLFPVMLMLTFPGIGRVYSLVLFIFVVISDWFDGFLARKYHLESRLGKFLDPLADKITIIGLFIFFIYLDPIVFPFWLIWLIAIREFVVTMIRIGGVSHGGKEVTTLMVGKVKTAVQFTTIFIIYFLFLIKDFIAIHLSRFRWFLEQNLFNSSPLWVHIFGVTGKTIILNLPTITLSIATILSLYSGIIYIYKNKEFFS
jgi:CDP-diacylglycerol--glycerol-3-phosphate 3-phosphatidyltransferase